MKSKEVAKAAKRQQEERRTKRGSKGAKGAATGDASSGAAAASRLVRRIPEATLKRALASPEGSPRQPPMSPQQDVVQTKRKKTTTGAVKRNATQAVGSKGGKKRARAAAPENDDPMEEAHSGSDHEGLLGSGWGEDGAGWSSDSSDDGAPISTVKKFGRPAVGSTRVALSKDKMAKVVREAVGGQVHSGAGCSAWTPRASAATPRSRGVNSGTTSPASDSPYTSPVVTAREVTKASPLFSYTADPTSLNPAGGSSVVSRALPADDVYVPSTELLRDSHRYFTKLGQEEKKKISETKKRIAEMKRINARGGDKDGFKYVVPANPKRAAQVSEIPSDVTLPDQFGEEEENLHGRKTDRRGKNYRHKDFYQFQVLKQWTKRAESFLDRGKANRQMFEDRRKHRSSKKL